MEILRYGDVEARCRRSDVEEEKVWSAGGVVPAVQAWKHIGMELWRRAVVVAMMRHGRMEVKRSGGALDV